MGDRIQRAWQTFVESNVDGKALRRVIDELEWDEMSDMDSAYFYAVVGKTAGEPLVVHFEGPTLPEYFLGASPSNLVIAIPAHKGMTKEDLLEFDAAEDSNYYL